MTAYFASTDIITSTDGSSIGAISFGAAGFGDGYSTIVYSNSFGLFDSQASIAAFTTTFNETQTLSTIDIGLADFLAFTDITTITDGSSIGESSFGAVGFGDGYSTIVYSNSFGLFDSQASIAAFTTTFNETQTLSTIDIGLADFLAFTDIITSTDGSSIGAISFGAAGFGDGYSTIVYSNVLNPLDTQISGVNYPVSETDSTQTLSNIESVSQDFAVSEVNSTQTLSNTQTSIAAFATTFNETQTLSVSNNVLASFLAFTDVVIPTTGSAIGESSFGAAGFGDGYSTLVYSNVLNPLDTQTSIAAFTTTFNETQTIVDTNIGGFLYELIRDETETVSNIETSDVIFSGAIEEPQILVDAEIALAAFISSKNESVTLIDYQLGGGWIKIDDTQVTNWVSVNNDQ